MCAHVALEPQSCDQNFLLSVGGDALGVAVLNVARHFRVRLWHENVLSRRVLRAKLGVAAPVLPEDAVRWPLSVRGDFLQSVLYYASTLCNTRQRVPQLLPVVLQ